MVSPPVKNALVLAAITLVASACGSEAPTAPQLQRPPEFRLITFSSAGPDHAPISSYLEFDFLVQFRSGAWEVWTGYGNPAPFPVFMAPRATRVTAEIQVTSGGASFAFKSVDLYSSVTPIPYAIVGTRANAKQFEATDTLPATGVVGNTFGAFRTVTSSTDRLIDTLTITLTNPGTDLGANPMGLDNIVLLR